MTPFASASDIARETRSGRLGCVEALEYYIARVERLDGALNAVVVRDFERARARARALDAGGRAEAGPLFGVPMTVKESYDLAGHPTTWGYPANLGNVAAEDALAVRRLEAAGAVVFGKTNVPVALGDWQSYNPIYGTTNNPWNPAHTPGGSSGGGAAALAAGMVGLEIGSDIGGSIRVPAHFCGVFGHKPTYGLAGLRGHALTPGAASYADISCIGPMARSAEDLAVAMAQIGQPDPMDSAPLALPPPRATTPRGLRVAVWDHERGQPQIAAVGEAVRRAASFLEAEGATVSHTARPELEPVTAYHLYLRMLDAALSARMPEQVLDIRREKLKTLPPDSMTADAIMLRGTDLTHRAWLQMAEQRARMRRAWQAFFQDWDVLLCPVIGTAALPHRQDGATWDRTIDVAGETIAYNDLLFWPGLTCGFHLPASTAPILVGADGLPVGVQIVGGLYQDATTIAVAAMLERAFPFVPPAGFA